MRKLYGGHLCLDFANTVEPRAAEPQHDDLCGYADLVRWGRHAGALDQAQAERLLAAAAGRPEAAEASFASAIDLREATYRTFAAVAAGDSPADGDLEVLQDAYAEAMRHVRLRPAADRLAWEWEDDQLGRAWWPMAGAAVELATAGQLDRVKQCPPGCGFLFFDASRNRIRRWCSMEECGGHEKARRQTDRRRRARAG
ncbi:MAG TPA: ABATE domain-containing protein [Actinomycetes bacterium]|jgi:predicted RNA-binding Zn ribbon-like protein